MNNPYQTPKSDIAPEPEISKKIINKIRYGVYCVVILGISSFFVVLNNILVYNYYYGLIDMSIIVFLGIGLHKKSRISAILIFLYFILSKLIQFQIQPIAAIIGFLFFSYFYFQAIIGTFQYHMISKK